MDLNNVPLVSGNSFIKWHLPSSNAPEHRNKTLKYPIKDHKVVYDYYHDLGIRFNVDKNSNLQELWLHLEIIQEYAGGGGRDDRIVLGHVRINLAEYVEPSDHEPDGSEGIVRRHLMQESKINSTLKIGILLRQQDGDRNFIAPPLKTAPVFGGIAGIMAGEQGEPDDVGHMPSVSSKGRDTNELQDLYRRTLAANWASQLPGELRADECIEDIFAGGDGWADKNKGWETAGNPSGTATPRDDDSNSLSDPDSPRRKRHWLGGDLRRSKAHADARGHNHGHRRDHSKGSLEQQAHQMKASSRDWNAKRKNEVDEFDVREDLRSWDVPTQTS